MSDLNKKNTFFNWWQIGRGIVFKENVFEVKLSTNGEFLTVFVQ